MGFAAVAAVAILMIAGVASFAQYQTEADSAQDEIRKAERDRDAREQELVMTSLTITGTQYQNGPNRLTIDLSNDGASTIDTSRMDLLIDGVVRTDDITWIRPGGQDQRYWHPLVTAEMRVDGVTSQPGRVAVVTHNGHVAYGEV